MIIPECPIASPICYPGPFIEHVFELREDVWVAGGMSRRGGGPLMAERAARTTAAESSRRHAKRGSPMPLIKPK